MLNKHTQGFHAERWPQAIAHLNEQSCPYVIVTLLGTAGSTPRDHGTKMVITADDIYDTVGGGHLEYTIIEQARALLGQQEPTQHLQHFPLGASLGQCCGGSVSVLFECFVPQTLPVDIYGAGHVAHALVQVLSALPVRIRWIDARADLFPATTPANVQTLVEPLADDAVVDALPGTASIVLTHNHQLDFAIVEKILRREDSRFLGVIGSATKATRFRLRLAHKGVSEARIQHMVCPVGLPDVPGKRPMEVAVSIAGQLIQLYHAQQTKPVRAGLQWRDLRQAMHSIQPDQIEATHD